MARTDHRSIEDYLRAQPPAARVALEQVRGALRKALPGAEEVISYQIAAFRLPGGIVLFFAGWKDHYALYPATGGLQEAFASELAPYEVSKGTIRFPLARPVPVRLIARLAKFRAREVVARQAARAAGRRLPTTREATKRTPTTTRKATTSKPTTTRKPTTRKPTTTRKASLGGPRSRRG
jgi:uncharacterized protein YdhG (YjbR/CyaY superfamily)